MADTAAHVDMEILDNATWEDGFQFGTPGDTSWNLTGQNFRMDLKRTKDDASAILSLTSGAGQIVVADPVQRIVYMNVPESTITGSLTPGDYVYDFIMFDTSSPPIRVPLMWGKVKLRHGITGG